MLADSINLPLVAFYGLAAFVPLTLVVVGIEAFVFWGLLRVGPRKSFRPLLAANILSTVAGWVIYGLQDGVLYLVGIRSFFDFVKYYLLGALLLIALYFGKSVLVEGLYMARRRSVERLGVGRGRLWRAVLVGNLASYLLVAPLFYFSTRPTRGGIDFLDGPAEVTTAADTVYFISADTGHLRRIAANGSGLTTVVPFEVADYLVSADETVFLCRGREGNLWYCPLGGERTLIWETSRRFHMTDVDLSAHRTHVAYATDTTLAVWSRAAGRVVAEASLSGGGYGMIMLAWDSEDPRVLRCDACGDRHIRRLEGDALVFADAHPFKPAGNYRRCGSGRWGSRYDWGVSLPWQQEQGELLLRAWSGLGQQVRVTRGDETLATLRNTYGLLSLGFPGPGEAFFLSEPGVVLCEGSGCLYVLNALTKRVAELADGRDAIANTPAFQASFDDDN